MSAWLQLQSHLEVRFLLLSHFSLLLSLSLFLSLLQFLINFFSSFFPFRFFSLSLSLSLHPTGVVVSFASTTLSNGAGVNWRLACNAEEDGGFANAITTSYVHNSPQNGGDYKSPFFYHVLLDIKQTDCTVEYTPTLGGEKNATGKVIFFLFFLFYFFIFLLKIITVL